MVRAVNRRVSLSFVLAVTLAAALLPVSCASASVKSTARDLLVSLDAARTDAVKVAAQQYTAKMQDAACDAACKAAATTAILRVNDLNVLFSQRWATAADVVSSWEDNGNAESAFTAALNSAKAYVAEMEQITGTTHTEAQSSLNLKGAAKVLLVALDAARTDAVNVAARAYVAKMQDGTCGAACRTTAINKINSVNDLNTQFSQVWGVAAQVLSDWSATGDSSADPFRRAVIALRNVLGQLETITGTTHPDAYVNPNVQ